MTLQEAAAAARPGVVLREAAGPDDELVLHGGGEVLRLPRTAEAAARLVLLVRALPRLRPLVPVAVPLPRLVGVLEDGSTPFTAERRLPGVPGLALEGPAVGQLAGLLAALADVPVREAQSWGVPGDGVLLHGALTPAALLVDPRRGVLTGVVGWRLRLGEQADDHAGLDPAVRAALG